MYMIVLALSGTRPIKSSKSVNIDPKFIFYSASDRKDIAKLYSAIWETTGTIFLNFESKHVFSKRTFNPYIMKSIFSFFFTVDLLNLARYRDRTVSVTKLWSQIYHPYCTLFTDLLILDYSTGLKLTINA